MKIRKILSFFLSVVVCVFVSVSMMVSVSAAELREKDVEKIVSLRERLEENIKITDVRNNLSSISSRYSKAQLEEIIGIVNDAASGTIAEEEYYIDLASEFSAEQTSEIYKIASGINLPVNAEYENEDNTDYIDNTDDISDNDDYTEQNNKHDTPKQLLNPVMLIIIVGIGVVIVALIAVILILILMKKNSGGKNGTSTDDNRVNNSVINDGYIDAADVHNNTSDNDDNQNTDHDAVKSDKKIKFRSNPKDDPLKPTKKMVVDDD